MSKDLKFLPLQKVEVVSGYNPTTPGSTGFICWIDLSISVIMNIIFIKYGKKGKARVSIGAIYSNVYDKPITNGINLTDMNILENVKDIMCMSVQDFVGYITAFSYYMTRLKFNVIGVASSDYIQTFLNQPHDIQPYKLSGVLLRLGSHDDTYAQALQIFNNKNMRSITMDKLQSEFVQIMEIHKNKISALDDMYKSIKTSDKGKSSLIDENGKPIQENNEKKTRMIQIGIGSNKKILKISEEHLQQIQRMWLDSKSSDEPDEPIVSSD